MQPNNAAAAAVAESKRCQGPHRATSRWATDALQSPTRDTRPFSTHSTTAPIVIRNLASHLPDMRQRMKTGRGGEAGLAE